MSTYADSSAIVSLYVQDAHSAEVQRQVSDHGRMWLTPLHETEWTHAIYQNVFRRALSNREALAFEAQLVADKAAGVWRVVPLPDNVFSTCLDLARRYAGRIGIRTLDTLHVAAALEFSATRFWTFDDRQAKLAKAAGLKLV